MARTRPVLSRPLIAAALALASLASAPATALAQVQRPSAEAIAAETRVQQTYALQAFLADIDRIERVTYPLLHAAAPYCAERSQWAIGAAPRSAAQVPPPLREVAGDVGLDAQLTFALVIAGTPVALAGVQRGDKLLSVNGQPVPAGPPAQPWLLQVVNRQWQATQRPLQFGLQRGGRTLDVAVTPQAVCAQSLRYVLSDAVNAAAGVNQLLVSSGMLRFAADDAELALVLGHELAHAVLRHPDGLAELPKQRDPYSQDKERDADQLGLYITAAAGYDIGHAADLWRRMAVRAPAAIAYSARDSFGASHPSSPERFLLLQAVGAQIAERRRRGESLLPPLAELNLRQGVAERRPEATPQPLPALAQLAGLNDEARAAYQAFSATTERPRALALSPRGHVSMRSGANAAGEALASCNVLARGACRLVALDDDWLGDGFVTLGPP